MDVKIYVHMDSQVISFGVRETFQYFIDGSGIAYKASENKPTQKHVAWRPSIHMPKVAARIWLLVEEIGIERLQDISSEDAKAEGIKYIRRTNSPCFMDYSIGEYVFPISAKTSFFSLWNKINGKRKFGL